MCAPSRELVTTWRMPIMKSRLVCLAISSLLLASLGGPPSLAAQGTPQTGTISGRVVDDEGAGVAGAQIFINPQLGTQTRADGQYTLARVPAGTHTLHARMLGSRPETATVTVTANQTTTQDFTLRRDPLQLQTMVVTGTQTPRTNLDAS